MNEVTAPDRRRPNNQSWKPRTLLAIPSRVEQARVIDAMVKKSIAVVDDFLISMIYQK